MKIWKFHFILYCQIRVFKPFRIRKLIAQIHNYQGLAIRKDSNPTKDMYMITYTVISYFLKMTSRFAEQNFVWMSKLSSCHNIINCMNFQKMNVTTMWLIFFINISRKMLLICFKTIVLVLCHSNAPILKCLRLHLFQRF